MSKAKSQTKPPSTSFFLYNTLWVLAALGAIAYIAMLVTETSNDRENAKIAARLKAGTAPLVKAENETLTKAIDQSREALSDLNSNVQMLTQKMLQLESHTKGIEKENKALALKMGTLENEIGLVTGALAKAKNQARKESTALGNKKTPDNKPNKNLIELATKAIEAKKLDQQTDPGMKRKSEGDEPLNITPGKIIVSDIPVPVLRPVYKAKPPQISRTHFAIELGNYDNLLELKARWLQLSKQHADLLEILHPRYMTVNANGATRYKLVSGPLPNALDAAKICYHLNAANIACKQTRFLGTPL